MVIRSIHLNEMALKVSMYSVRTLLPDIVEMCIRRAKRIAAVVLSCQMRT